jgi:hypothetical protein
MRAARPIGRVYRRAKSTPGRAASVHACVCGRASMEYELEFGFSLSLNLR